MTYRVINGDCLIEMKKLAEEGVMVDSIVSDPPYHLKSIVSRFGNTSLDDDNVTGKKGKSGATAMNRLSRGFMGKTWDGGDIANRPETWKLAYDVLKPGGYLLAFGGTRTFHRMACAIEDAGFEIRDCLMWVYGSGFPKSHNIGKYMDKMMGAERKVVGKRKHPTLKDSSKIEEAANAAHGNNTWSREWDITSPTTTEAKQWDGFGTALKPAWEPIIFARKPISEKTVAANVLKYGTGGINIDDCRIELAKDDPLQEAIIGRTGESMDTGATDSEWGFKSVDREAGLGRWPANVIHDGSDEVEESFAEYGVTISGKMKHEVDAYDGKSNVSFLRGRSGPNNQHGDSGSVSRFFYSAKASAKDRVYTCTICDRSLFKEQFKNHTHEKEDFNHIESHPTCKPISLMRYLVRLVTPPNGTVLDPFSGSGTTLQAAVEEGFNPIGIELDPTYFSNINYRLENMKQEEKTPTLYD